MLSLRLFHLLDDIGKIIRRSNRPFGGMQVIFSGDFFQLPPVGKEEDPESSQFCFESPRFNSMFPFQIELKKIFRQDDEVYITVLNQIREGMIKRSSNELLLSLIAKEKPSDLVITKLFPKRFQVDAINAEKMEALEGEISTFELQRHTDLPLNSKEEKRIRNSFTAEEIQIELEFISNSLLCDRLLTLKKGSQVMCVVNMKEDGVDVLCNGSQGIVIKFCEVTKAPIVKFNNGIIRTMGRYVWPSDKIPGVGVSQIPLILAWALTIHKSQGSTLDMAEVDVGSGIFECGQTYVALSRVKNLNGLYLTSFDHTKIRVFRKVKDFYEALRLKNAEAEAKKSKAQEESTVAVAEPDPNIKVIKLLG
jgi:ATP-dependent DNA helicase PIF1